MEFLIFLEKWGSLIVASFSILISIVSLIKAINTQKLQNKVNILELKIKEFEVQKICRLKQEENDSCVEARVIKLSNNNYRLKVWNSGKTKVESISTIWSKDAQISVFNNKMPFEFLEPNKSFEVQLIVDGGSMRKFLVTTKWKDLEGNQKTKEQMCDF